MNLYHYNTKRFDELLTRDLQGAVSSKERKDGNDAAAFRNDIGPYFDSVSFLLEPAPLDFIASVFPKDHHTWTEGNKLFEHVVDLEKQDFYGWTIAEGPVSMLFIDYVPWNKNPYYKRLFFKSLSVGRRLFRESGEDFRSLERALERFPKGTTRDAYRKVPDRKDYDDIKDMYAATVPHLMVYTKSPIKVKETNKVTVGSGNVSQEAAVVENKAPLSAFW